MTRHRQARTGSILGSAFLFLVVACGQPTPRRAGPPSTANDLTLTDIENATYHGIYDVSVRLTDGRFEGEPFQPGAASHPTLTLLPEHVTFADVDDNGSDEGIALLVESSGGSGSFVHLAVVTSRAGEPESLATTLIGDRVTVTTLEIDGQTIRATVVAPPPGGPMTGAGRTTVRHWELRSGALVENVEEITFEAPQ